MRFDLMPGLAVRRLGFDHVGIERPLHEIFHAGNLGCFFFEHGDKLVTDDDAFAFRVFDAGKLGQKAFARVNRDHRKMHDVAKRRQYRRRFPFAQQSMIDEDAGELLADRARDQRCGDRRIDPARERADDLVAPDFNANLVDGAIDERLHLPIVGQPRNPVQEVAKDRRSGLRVHHLGVKLHAVDFALRITHRGNIAAGRRSERFEASWKLDHRITVRHPHARLLGHTLPERRFAMRDRQCGGAIFGVIELDQFRSEIARNELHSVANAQQRQAALQNRGIETRRAVDQRTFRTARKNDRRRIARRKLRPRDIVGTISQYTPSSRVRRAMSWLYCAPKSRIKTVGGIDRPFGCPPAAPYLAAAWAALITAS